MNARQCRMGVAGGIAALGLVAVLVASQARAQQTERIANARPKVASATQASYTDPDPAPTYEVEPPLRPKPAARHFSYERNRNGRPNGGPAAPIADARPPQRRYANQRAAYQEPIQGEEILPTPDMGPGEVQYGDEGYGEWDGPTTHGHRRGGNCASCGDCGRCDACCRPACPLCYGPWVWDNFSIFGGVQGFKGPVDLGANGNFGFHEGLNWGIPLWDACGIGFQAGFQAVHSDLSGTLNTSDSRDQYFSTIGLFRRPLCGEGIQYGIVWDHQTDDFASRNVDLNQVRVEISAVGCNGHEIGFWGALGGDEDFTNRNDSTTTQNTFGRESVDMYNFFYRKRFCNGASARVWFGATSDSEGLFGTEAIAPLTRCISLQGAFNYRIPNESTQTADARSETWGMALNLVWYPGYKNSGCHDSNPYRPLFGVADNTTFFVNQH